jgi:hypothetical protein
MPLPILPIAASLAISNPGATMLAVGGATAFFWDKLLDFNSDSFSFDSELDNITSSIFDNVNTTIESQNAEIKSHVDIESSKIAAASSSFVESVSSEKNKIGVSPLSSINESSIVSNPTSLLDVISNTSAENTNMLRNLVAEQKEVNVYMQSLVTINATRLANEQKQTLILESQVTLLTEHLASITSSLAQIGTISGVLRNGQVAKNKAMRYEIEKNILQSDELQFNRGHEAYSSLKNSSGKIIIPREAKALKDSEKAIETQAMNKTEIDSGLIDSLFDSTLKNPFDSLIEEAVDFLKNMNENVYDINTNKGRI